MPQFLTLINSNLLYKDELHCFGASEGYTSTGVKYGQTSDLLGFSPLNHNGLYFKQEYTNTTNYLITTPKNIYTGKAVSSNLYIYPKFSNTFAPLDLTKSIENCFIYQDYYNSSNSCATCGFGYFGIIDNYKVEFCTQYGPSSCIKCIHGKYP